MPNLLYVCERNRHRSAVAEYVTKQKAARKGVDINVKSAGLDISDESIPEILYEAMEKKGYQTGRDHRPRPLDDSLVNAQNLILCFSDGQKRRILEQYPGIGDKTYTVKEYLGQAGDISDKKARKNYYRRMNISPEEHEKLLQANIEFVQEISSYADRVLERLVETSSPGSDNLL